MRYQCMKLIKKNSIIFEGKLENISKEQVRDTLTDGYK